MKYQIKYHLYAVTLFVVVLFSCNVFAAGYPWSNHAHPYDFEFGNSFDSHQQSKISGDRLEGFFYITYTGFYVGDLPEATHGTETLGWILNGIQAQATLIANPAGQHPTWCLDSLDIPQSQGFTHFHWVGPVEHEYLIVGDSYSGYLLKLTAIDSFFLSHAGGFEVLPGIDYYSHDNIVTDCQ